MAPVPTQDPPPAPRPETESRPQLVEPIPPRPTSWAANPATPPATTATAMTYGAQPAQPRDAHQARPFRQLRAYGEDTFRTPGDDVRLSMPKTSVAYRWMKEALTGLNVGTLKVWRRVRSRPNAEGLYVGEYEAIADALVSNPTVSDAQIDAALRRLSQRFSSAMLQTLR